MLRIDWANRRCQRISSPLRETGRPLVRGHEGLASIFRRRSSQSSPALRIFLLWSNRTKLLHCWRRAKRPARKNRWPTSARNSCARSCSSGGASATTLVFAQAEPRARDLGIPFDGTPGPLNAITDVAGVEVGFTTLISGSGKLVGRPGPSAHRGDGRLPSRQEEHQRSSLRRMVLAQRQWRDDRHHLGRGVGLPRRSGDDHQHPQCGSRARCRDQVAHRAWRRRCSADTGGRCRWWPKPGTASSTTSTAFT